jgi:hypothetical protein
MLDEKPLRRQLILAAVQFCPPTSRPSRGYAALLLLFGLLLWALLGQPLLRRAGSSRSLYYSPLGSEASWVTEHAALLPTAGTLAALRRVRFRSLNATQPGGLCLGVLLFRRSTPYIYTLLLSLALKRLQASGSSPVDVPHSLAVYWVPSNATDASSSTIHTALQGLGVDVVLVGDPRSSDAPIIGPPQLFAAAMQDMLQRSPTGACRSLLVLEDDAAAELEWEAAVAAALAAADAVEPDWRLLKLHRPDTLNRWDWLSLALALLVFLALFLLCAYLVERSGSAPPPRPCRKHARTSLLLAFLLLLAMWLLGRSLAPCHFNHLACPGVHRLRDDFDMTCTQAQAFNPRTARAFADCMAETPSRGRDAFVCWQVDWSMHRCLVSVPADPSADKCSVRWQLGLVGLLGLHPSVFQHTGIINSYGEFTSLRISDTWDASGATLKAFMALK